MWAWCILGSVWVRTSGIEGHHRVPGQRWTPQNQAESGRSRGFRCKGPQESNPH